MNRNLKRIAYNNLIQFIDDVGETERDKEIIRLGLAGVSAAEIARKFNLSSSRIPMIYWQFVMRCGEAHGVLYHEDEPPEPSKIYYESREHKADLAKKKAKKELSIKRKRTKAK